MADAAIAAAVAAAVKWANSLCKDDPKCIVVDGHKGDHRDLTTTWPRVEPTTLQGDTE